MDSAAKWYIDRDGKYLGPYSWDQVKQLAKQGEILPKDILWNKDVNLRDRADQISGLFPYKEKEMYGRDAEVLPDYRKNRNTTYTILIMGIALILIIIVSVFIKNIL